LLYRYTIICFGFLFFLSNGSFLSAKTYPSARFEKPKFDGEFSDERIESGLVARSGLVWLSTNNGLIRYDGYSAKRYQHDSKNLQSISGNHLLSIMEDKNGLLWIGTKSSGLNRFDPTTETFTHFTPEFLKNTSINYIHEDSFGIIWIATLGSGLIRLDPKIEKFSQYLSGKDSPSSIQINYVWKVIEDRKNLGNLWVATSDGLDYFMRENQSFTHYQTDKNDKLSISNNAIHEIRYDSNDTLWIGTESGLNQFVSSNNSFLRYYPDIENSSQFDFDNDISAIYEDSDRRLFIGTFEGGLKLFNRETKSFFPFRHNPSNQYSLRQNQINHLGIFENSSGLLWILTATGINQLNLSSLYFKNFHNEVDNPDSLSGNIVWAIHEDQNGRLWIGTNDNGLNQFDEIDNRFIHFRHDPKNINTIDSDTVYSIIMDSEETLWVGTNRGLNRRNKGDTHFQHYYFDKGKSVTTQVYNLMEDHRGLIWIGTTNGLIKFDKNNAKFTTYRNDDKDPDSLIHQSVAALLEDSSGQVWVGTPFGLELYNRKTDKFTHITNTPLLELKPHNRGIKSINQTKNGDIWFSMSSSGVYRVRAGSTNIEKVSQTGDLVGNIAYGIIEDKNENLWIATNAGLSRFNPRTEVFYNFYQEDGIQNGGYNNLKSWARRKNGEIMIGGANGIDFFKPEDITITSKAPPIILTDFLIFNRSVPLQSSFSSVIENLKDAPYLLEKSINHTKELTLTHKESMFSFEFAALDYLRPNKNQYAYKMEGLDEDWIHTPASKRFATYMNVPAGEYVFRVKGSNKNGMWNEEGRSIKVIILPPPWLTWWAKTLYAIFIITSLVGFYAFRTRALRHRAVELETTVKTRTQELAEEKQKVEKLLTQKTEEFANVSHEFRTPLTLILGPLSQLIKSNKKPDEIKRLNIIQRNGYRLLRMVDQLLNLETFRVKPVTQRQPINTAQTIRTLTEAFTDLANDKGIKIELNQLAHANFEFTADAFEKIILNLLSNALKYTKLGGSISIETSRKNDELMIQIIDTGIGIPADKLEAIFERFNRVLDKNSEQVTGAGIGLALVKNLVKVHQGKIDITSQLGQGTQVTVTLPIINEVDESEINLQTNDEIIEMELISLTEQAKQQLVDDQLSLVQKDSEQPTVLVIEDNQDMRDYIVGSLGDDYQTITASNGEEGVNLAKQEVPDLIISDIMMPKKDGFETTKELRNNDITSHIPIILLTALGDHENRIKGWQEKVDEYLTKPFNTEELKTRIVNLLEIRNILKRRFGETVFEQKETNDEIKSNVRNDLSIAEKNKHQLQQQFVKQVNEKLETRYSDASICIADLASSLAMSERQIFRKLKSTVDMTPTEYLRRFRLEKAKEQLLQGNSSSNTAFDVGFSSQSYFAKCFKAQYGVSPREFMNQA